MAERAIPVFVKIGQFWINPEKVCAVSSYGKQTLIWVGSPGSTGEEGHFGVNTPLDKVLDKLSE